MDESALDHENVHKSPICRGSDLPYQNGLQLVVVVALGDFLQVQNTERVSGQRETKSVMPACFHGPKQLAKNGYRQNAAIIHDIEASLSFPKCASTAILAASPIARANKTAYGDKSHQLIIGERETDRWTGAFLHIRIHGNDKSLYIAVLSLSVTSTSSVPFLRLLCWRFI